MKKNGAVTIVGEVVKEKLVHPEHPLLHKAYYERAVKVNTVGVNGGGYPLSLIQDNFEEENPLVTVLYEDKTEIYSGELVGFDANALAGSLKDAKIINATHAGFEKTGFLKLKKIPRYIIETDAISPACINTYFRSYEIAKVVNIGKCASYSAIGVPHEEYSLWLLTSVLETPFEVEVPEEYYEAVRRMSVFEVPCIVTYNYSLEEPRSIKKIKILVSL